MTDDKQKKKKTILTLLEAGISIAELLLSMRLLSEFASQLEQLRLDYSGMHGVAAMLFFAMAAMEVVRFFAERGGSRLTDVRHLTGAGIYLVGAVLLLALHGDGFSTAFAVLGYAAMLAFQCVESVLRDRRVRSILRNAFALLLIAVFLGTRFRTLFCPIFLFLQSLWNIVTVAFARVNFRALRRIIRKTYTVEIIFGMLLLMVAFSILLTDFEPGMESFGDALWYCFALVTTIGFGDVSAATIGGRILSVILGVYGIIVVSLITSVIVNFYGEVKNEPDDDPLPDDTTEKEDADTL